MKGTELISIILPVYNGGKYLARAIESCLNQTYKDIELIIVNDCSTDTTLAIADHYAKIDARVRVVNNETNQKLPACLNIGHKEANGNYITWTSDDNLYKEYAIETLFNELVLRETDVVFSDFYLIDNEGDLIREVEYVNFENVIFGNFVGASFLYKKEVFQRNKGYNEHLFLVEDYDFWLRALIHSQFFHLKKKLYYYRTHEDSLTNGINSSNDKKQLWKNNLKTMYANFCLLVSGAENEEIGIYLAKRLSNQKIPFAWFVDKHQLISDFKVKLKQNINFSSDGDLIEKIFLKKIIEAMIQDSDYKTNLAKSIFIFRKYARFADKNDLKTMIKYSFFKTNK